MKPSCSPRTANAWLKIHRVPGVVALVVDLGELRPLPATLIAVAFAEKGVKEGRIHRRQWPVDGETLVLVYHQLIERLGQTRRVGNRVLIPRLAVPHYEHPSRCRRRGFL